MTPQESTDPENPFYAKQLKDRETRPTCKTCPYWNLMDWSDSDFTWGLCVIRAPGTIAKDDYDDERPPSIWPGTLADDFCGEHPDFRDYLKSRSANSIP